MKADAARDILTAKAIRVPVDPTHPESEIFVEAASIIRHGGVIAYPTETFYGLAVDPFNARAVDRLFRIKGRATTRAVILLLAQPGQAFDVAVMTGLAREWFETLARVFWPGPLTLVLPVRPRLRCPALAGGSTVAVRLSSHPVAARLARATDMPITSTSANFSGAPPADSAEAIDPTLATQLDLVLDAGPTTGGMPSTVLDLTAERPAILRQGSITAEQIEPVIRLKPRPAVLPPPEVAQLTERAL